ncbi:hypothetical protein H8356DRAFT_1087458 [Neocallimastix lanati (nom. inval.)]|uniref:Uncharacterized protein n=1 Tax=Neocallimastix californiae TaxID=1754190 RepID=A0A1Y2EXV7_9FUNG|nr:hypothetical protein H8356DRAFT_1087458 [Neocallimastix sp. JGI-2020a]ORY76410.1 hypothetical protein LY90DRAFT_501726 [Neocallimastix californiae]|eukprot:ORY76410.1 hypothetical protein LY90DRAFT_501726 [Neocallimastix californiae]
MAIEDLILFKLEMNDTLNTKIIGQATNYCMDYSCILPNFRRKYSKFENNTFPININIRKCDESLYKFQFRDDNQFESCYIPHCQPSCNKGICISDNLCDCSNTYLTGKNCNEYLKLERNYTLDMSIKIISFLLVLISMISIVTLYIYKNNYIIKGAVIRLRDKNFGICISMNITRNLVKYFLFS